MRVEWTITADCDDLPNGDFKGDALNATYAGMAGIVEDYLGDRLEGVDVEVKVIL